MQLNFEIINTEVGTGSYPDVIHFANTQAQILNIKRGELFGVSSNKIDLGEWNGAVFQEEIEASPDIDMSHFEVKVLPGWGIIGGYKSGNIHKMIIYEFAWEMGEYLNNASIKHSIDNPISSFNLDLENPDLKDPEKPGNIATSEQISLLSPGAKVLFKFGAGEDEVEFEMGTFYVDRSNFTLLSETASVDGRNLIGKALKDSTVDEKNEYWYASISENIKNLLESAQIDPDNFVVENTNINSWFNFSPNIDNLKALETMLEPLPQWRIREKADGTIVVGSENYAGFEQRGIYAFYRDKDVFSRQIIRDDAQVYNRVCVHTENYSRAIYRDVTSYTGWNLSSSKTLYIQVANGLKISDMENYADELASRLEGVGKIESFTGPFRPHVQCGDEAIIIAKNGSESLGLVTEITHNSGKDGFYTNFTVDSGGSIGKGRLSDFINKIAIGAMSQKADIGWNDIDTARYLNLAEYAKVNVSSQIGRNWGGQNLNDGYMYESQGEGYGEFGWKPINTEINPFVILNLGQRCLVNKIKLFVGLDDAFEPTNAFMPTYYKIQYWNSAFWVDLLEETNNTKKEIIHNFEAIETSAIRVILQTGLQNWREIEIWGNM